MVSEFYHLRRNAIKDITAYLSFLAGFIGSAPLAWSALSPRLQSEDFVRGLWYFFGTVLAAGMFAGIAGLGLGHVLGIAWEQIHRQRRPSRDALPPDQSGAHPTDASPRLKLVTAQSGDFPKVMFRRLTSVRFLSRGIELDFRGTRVEVSGNAQIACGSTSVRYPEPGARDALCALIGSRVESVRSHSKDNIEISFESGCALVIARGSSAVA